MYGCIFVVSEKMQYLNPLSEWDLLYKDGITNDTAMTE